MEISLRNARSFIVQSQLLSKKKAGVREAGALQIIEHLGYVQIDTISVIARAHHHILWTRMKKYDASYLSKLEKERQIFEYWAHAASYLPMRDFRFSLFSKKKISEGKGHWWPREEKWIHFVYDRIKAEGPLMARDFKKDPALAHDHAWGGHPVTQALRQLFMEGKLMISGRKGFQKIYDLSERVLPTGTDTTIPGFEEYYKYLITRDLQASGLMKATEIGHLISIPKKKLDILLSQLVEANVLEQVKIKGISSGYYYALKDRIASFAAARRTKYFRILSPFDNLIIQRKRVKELFDFEYVLECYVPASKRKVGYFSLPLLYGTDFVGQIDLKADRKRGHLIIRNLQWKEGLKNTEILENSLHQELQAFMAFNECQVIIDPSGQ